MKKKSLQDCRKSSRGRWWLTLCGLVLFAAHASADVLNVQHNPILCATPGAPIPLVFRVISPVALKEARVYFKTLPLPNFYFIAAAQQPDGLYQGNLPGPLPSAKMFEYRILVVDQNDQSFMTPDVTVMVGDAAVCPQTPPNAPRDKIVVLAEQEIAPENGFSGDNVSWQTTEADLRPPYFSQAAPIPLQPLTTAAAQPSTAVTIQKQQKSGRSLKKTAVIGLGAAAAGGLGAALALGGGGDGGGDTWSSLDDPAENVTATILKSPSIQTSCGTTVTNQLFVANNSQADVRIGLIDYEVVLKVDKPAGNCEPGQRGTFAPDGNPVIAPGDNVLIRQWSNVVNSCRSCPYAQAECVWESRYIVHTSAGSAVALATFTAEGDLCGTASAKSVQAAAPLAGDFLP